MPPNAFVIALSDLEQGPKYVTFSLTAEWLTRALAEAKAQPAGEGTLSLTLEKHGEEVMVRGQAHARVSVPCVVTLDPVAVDLEPEIFLLLRRVAPPPGERGKSAKKREKSLEGPRREPRRRRKLEPWQDEPELSGEDAGRDTFQGDEITLDGFVREFLLLEVPPYPRRVDLPSSEESILSRPLAEPTGGERLIDPRLEPLAKLAARLRGEEQKKE